MSILSILPELYGQPSHPKLGFELKISVLHFFVKYLDKKYKAISTAVPVSRKISYGIRLHYNFKQASRIICG